MHTYEHQLTGVKDAFIVIQVREDGRRRQVSTEHHAYLRWLAEGGEPPEIDLPAPPAQVELTEAEAEDRAVQEFLGEYMAALSRWDAFGHTTKTEALAPWRARVASRVDELIGD